MLFHGKKFSDIVLEDLQSLIDDKVAEGKSIEYKSQLPGRLDKDKAEFLADVSSFSNAAGGWIFYGIVENEGLPTGLIGLPDINIDQEKQRFENLLRNSIAPRLPRISIRGIEGGEKGPILAIHIARSWASPHMVTFSGGSKFYSRNSVGKYPLDVDELREAFTASSISLERIRNFRLDKVAKIVANEGPVQLEEKPKAILHLIPMDAFNAGIKYDLIPFQLHPACHDLSSLGKDHCRNLRFNFDGIITSYSDGSNRSCSYVQLFRTGIIESVTTELFNNRNGHPSIPSTLFEQYFTKGLTKYLSVQNGLETEPPFFVFLSLVGVKNYDFPSDNHFPNIIDRNDLLVSEVFIEDRSSQPEVILRPIFDSVWNAAGLPRSPNYDEKGKWRLKNST